VTATSAGDNALRFQVTGSIGPLIRALADKPIVSLTSRAPSLEEIFLHHYSSSNGDGSS
jgi:ABC-2 type transport system ATP-binding protein